MSLQLTFQEAQIARKCLNELMSLDREDVKEHLLDSVSLEGDISFKNVCFAYGSRPPVVRDLNLDIPQGSRVTFVK